MDIPADHLLLIPGLLSRDALPLSVPHLLILLCNVWLWLSPLPARRVAGISLLCAAGVGWGRMLCFDVLLTWNQLDTLSAFPALSDLAFLNHLKFQPPAWTWYLAACPSYPMQQINALAVSALILGLCFRLYPERTARRIAATPLFLLMASQPMTGVYAVACLLAARVCWRDGCRGAAIAAAFLASQCTYTAYAIYPFLAVTFGSYGAILWLAVGLYWLAFSMTDTRTYTAQVEFVVRMFSFGAVMPSGVKSFSGIAARNMKRVDRNLLTLIALLWYGFPAYLGAAWGVWLCGGLLVFGGGNVKYLALIAACFPAKSASGLK